MYDVISVHAVYSITYRPMRVPADNLTRDGTVTS